MKAEELLRRYRKGERDFRGVDLSGESLQGMNLTGIDLSGANLNQTDLCGTRFTEAKLIGTQLYEAKTSNQEGGFLHLFPLALMPALFLNGPASALLGLFVALVLEFIISPSGKITGTVSGDLVCGLIGLVSFGVTFCCNYFAGIVMTLRFGAFIVTYVVAVASAVAVLSTNKVVTAENAVADTSIIAAVAIAAAVAISAAIVVAIVVAVAGAVAGIYADVYAYAVVVTFASIVSYSITGFVVGPVNDSNESLVVKITVVVVLLVTGINCLISHRALSGESRDKFLRDVAVAFISTSGTHFDNADLTNANFSKAILKGADFYEAILHNTCFHLSQQLHLAQVSETLLDNHTVLNLLVSLRPEPNTSYAGLDLKGAYLAHANLADLDLTETDLSGATLEGADLQRTTLTKVQVLGTNFHQANLTAACIESWNIDSNTQLAGALCEHVYLSRNQQERRPNSGTFNPGEFSELFEEVLHTIDLIFSDGMDWQAFMQTFQTIQVEHEGAELEIQGIEKKGNGVMVVRLDTHPEADKPAIHAAFKQDYELKLAAVETKYKALLASKEQTIDQKDELIQLHRQQSADMKSIAESLAQRPVTVDVTATANSKTGDETINIQGDANNSTVRIGDTLGDLESKGASREQAGEADG